ncbi:hypothetical protein BGZ98_010442 [Dissophora globulifera]|nr:hypothetical protein BGZ98_010442 [Dissophora globulifera]
MTFSTLILDALTLSFEVNVMDLTLGDVSAQAALLLVPDLLAFLMIFGLLIYTANSICCCFGNMEDLHDDHNNDEVYEDEIDSDGDDYVDPEGDTTTTARGRRERERGAQDRVAEKYESNDDQDLEEQEEPLEHRRNTRIAFSDYPDSAHRAHHTHPPIIAITSPREGSYSTATELQDDTSISSSSEAPSLSAATLPTASAPAAHWRGRKRYLNLYIIIRVLLTLGIVVLALYWPARHLKPPLGSLPDIDSPRSSHHGDGPYPDGDLSGGGNGTTRHGGTGPNEKITGSTVGMNASQNLNNQHTKSYGLTRWCALEEAYGDDDSATVYCNVKVVRPAFTYIWAVFLCVELCVAAMAGDFGQGVKDDAAERSEEPMDREDDEHSQHAQGAQDTIVDEEMSVGSAWGVGRAQEVSPEIEDETNVPERRRRRGGKRRREREVH